MCIKTQTSRFTGSSWAQLERLAAALQEADAVLVGAGAGLSTSAGFAYSGERFRRYFGDFEAAYGFHDMYSGGFYPFPTSEEHWAYWSRFIFLNRYCDPPKPVYQNLLELVKDKDTFVLTTNVDHCFQKAGFDKHRLFYTQGFQVTERGLLPPAQPKRAVPTELVPRCPVCGAPMAMNLRADNTFVQDDGWHQAAQRYEWFLRSRKELRVVFLELGVGYNTPGIIKYPFWQMTAANPQATYVCVNSQDALCPREIEQQSLCIQRDIYQVLEQLVGR